MKNLSIIFILLSISFLSSAQSYPNIIVILADDQGWTGTSVLMDPDNPASKSDYYETPNLESLASNGMRFSQAYASAPKCSPSRMSLLTGQTTARNQFTNTSSRVTSGKLLEEPSSNNTIPTSSTTIAEYLSNIEGANYTSAYYGKWHLGNGGPESHGFDDSDGNTSNGDGDTGASTSNDPKQIFSMTQQGIYFMNQALTDSKPFFLQLSHYAVHTGIESTPESLTKYSAKQRGSNHDNEEYAAMTEDLDVSVGLILNYLEEKGLLENTYIVYTSDNGAAANLSSNAPLNEGKTFVFEGGIRVPLIISGPNITANSHSKFPVVGYDFLPTFYDLIGADMSDLLDVDGESFKPVLEDVTAFPDRKPLIFHSPHYDNSDRKTPRSAIVNGTEKLVIEYETGNRLGYNLATDLGEFSHSFDFAQEDDAFLLVTLRDYLKQIEAQMPVFSSTNTDTDGDELPDVWEFKELLGTLFIGSDDPDEDGLTNLEEFTAGTDPLISDKGEQKLLVLDQQSSPLVYPSLASSFLKVNTSSHVDKHYTLSLHDLNGVRQLITSITPSENKVNVTNIFPGLYIYELSTGNKTIARGKLIIK